MNTIKLDNVWKKYDNRVVLTNVNLEIKSGEIFTILGPSGAGKTTLLKIMSGIEAPTGGTIFRENAGRSAMVFQKTVLFNTTVYKNVAYGLKLRNYSRGEIEKRVKEVLKVMGIEIYEGKPARKLSGGEQQRVSLAMALVLEPELLFLDEPTANLDPANAARIEKVIRSVKGRTTIVLATHNLFQARRLSDRIALLNQGGIEQISFPEDIFRKPQSEFTAEFVGVNLFRGNAEKMDYGTKIRTGRLEIMAVAEKTGDVSVSVSPEDIIVSRESIKSSARNVFRGRVTDISDYGTVIHLKVDVDGQTFIAFITRQSSEELGIVTGAEVFIAFKASSVHVF
jgi:molybdopterin-binding protein